MKKTEKKSIPGNKNKYKDGVKTAILYNKLVPAEKLEEIKEAIDRITKPYQN